MAPYIQSASATNGTTAVASTSVAFATNNTSGNLLVASFRYDSPAGVPATATVADTNGNTWVLIDRIVYATSGDGAELWYCANCKGGANTVTMTPASSTGYQTIIVAEYSGIARATPLDGHAAQRVASASGTDAATSGQFATTGYGDLVVCGLFLLTSTAPSYSAGTGFTERIRKDTVASGNAPIALGDFTQSAPSATTAGTWTTGSAVNVFVFAAAFTSGATAFDANLNGGTRHIRPRPFAPGLAR